MIKIETEVEDEGAQLNAYTSRELTCYYMTLFKDKIQWGVEFLADMLIDSKYEQS